MESKRRLSTICSASIAAMTLSTPTFVYAEESETPFGAAVLIIELTDNDIELQVFADGFDYTRLKIFDPNERKVFDGRARGRLKRQGGLSEVFFASEPSHYLVDEPDFDEPVEDFLKRWPEGVYEFEGTVPKGPDLEGEATLSHVLPALPKIVSPVSAGEKPPVVDPDNLVIDWEPVTTRFTGRGPVEIFEYQVILDLVDPERSTPWVDGGTRRALINLPPDVTELTVPAEFLEPGSYEFEILAIEMSGNSTISVGEFVVEEEER